ncbi:MAG: carbohydrate ABC transporter permease [Clostridia bacterium]|nr:carbohydrate ABC transporter permease [Clostridia bacterium]
MSAMKKRNNRGIAVRETAADRVFNIVNITLLAIIALIVLYPLYFVVCASFTDPMVVNQGGLLLYPVKWYAQGYHKIFAFKQLWSGYSNSLIYMVLGTTVNMVITIPCAYAVSRKDFVGRGLLLKIFAFTMFFSGGLIPSYLINSKLGLRDNLWAMIIPTGLSVWNMIIARTFFETSLPSELLDAAHIDGCNDFRFFFQIALPLSKAMLAVIVLYYAVGHWNGYFHAMIYLNKESKFPLQLVLRNLLIVNQVTSSSMTDDLLNRADKIRIAEQLKYGIIVVASVPLLVLYPFLQKYFTKGVLVGSIKG